MSNSWTGKKVVVTGAGGTVGKEIVRQLLPLAPKEIIGIDNNEMELFFLNEQYRSGSNAHFFLGDVRQRESLVECFRGCDVVLHAAALKHVGLCEESPRQAVQTNILGTQNVIDAAMEVGVARVVLTSSDKAVNSTNVMGTSKLMAERLMTAADAGWRGAYPVCGSVRFGNVLGSRGSVIPLFRRQIAGGGPVTLTHPEMTRFIMTLSQAAQLVLEASMQLRGGEVFVTKMRVIRLEDLAAVMIEELSPGFGHRPSDIAIKIIGPRPGEKMFEELMTDEEATHAVETGPYLVILPRLRTQDKDTARGEVRSAHRPYNSAGEVAMSRDELRQFVHDHNLLTEGT
jgi:FlaA1/EpsC-like NDP-sugar epimerase